jgi:CheY-like chemotaxis protein
MGQTRLNSQNIVALIVDRDHYARGLIAQMLRGFGISAILSADKGAEAKELLSLHCPDIAFVEGELSDMTADELIGWVRHNPKKNLRFLPIIVLSGYTQLRMVLGARDAGSHLVIRKPVSPQVLFDRLVWAANCDRSFLESSAYVGPDRRFHAAPSPDDTLKRKPIHPNPR